MRRKDPRSAWYDQTLPKQKRNPRRSRTGLWIALAILLNLCLIAGVVLLRLRAPVSFHFRINGREGGFGQATETPTPEYRLPEDYTEDFRDYFSDYYHSASASAGESSSLPRGSVGGDFRLELTSGEVEEDSSLQQLYSACSDCVVGILATAKNGMGYYWGSGVILSEDGYIVTNQHIIASAASAEVQLSDGDSYPAVLIGEDVQTDLAVLKIEATGLHAAVFGDSAALQVGDSVAAIGNPLTDSLCRTMTNGIVSAINRSIYSNGRSMTLIQTNAALNEGNSGGALFNLRGQVVGITNMKMSSMYSEVSIEGIGFAIPSTTVRTVVNEIIARGAFVRPGIGITVGAIPADAAAHYQLPEGLYITKVEESCDAYAKGVRVGDILTHVDGMPVTTSDDVLSCRDSHAIGDQMALTIYRDGRYYDVVITLQSLDELY